MKPEMRPIQPCEGLREDVTFANMTAPSSFDIEIIAKILSHRAGRKEIWQDDIDQAVNILIEVEMLSAKIDINNNIIEQILFEDEKCIDFFIGEMGSQSVVNSTARVDDYPVGGIVWRVHKTDSDPYPSQPHAHCLSGKAKFVGCKLHLGTAEFYKGRKPSGRYLAPKHFFRLIEMIQPKFPNIVLPLPSAGLNK